MDLVPAEAIAGVVLGAVLGLCERRFGPRRVPVWAIGAVIVVVPYGLRRELWFVAICLVVAVPVAGALAALARRHTTTTVLTAAAWSTAAAALATPDTEGPLLLAGVLAAAALSTAGRPQVMSATAVALVGLAWALAIAHGAGGRPPSLAGAVGAWAVPAAVAIGGPLPVVVWALPHALVAPWLARVVGLGRTWLAPVAVVVAAVAVLTVLVAGGRLLRQRAGRHAGDRSAGRHVVGDDGPGPDHDVVADATTGQHDSARAEQHPVPDPDRAAQHDPR